MFKTVNKLSIIVSLAIVGGLIIGLTTSLLHILANHYINYSMGRMIAFSLQKHINLWTIGLIIFSLTIFLILFFFWLLECKDKNTALKLRKTIAGLICSFFFFYGIWRINRYWLAILDEFHIISLLCDFVLLILSILFFLLFVRINLNKFFNQTKIKYLKISSIVSIILILFLNLSIFIDNRVNLPKGPNVLFIIIDSLRADHLSGYGYNRNTSPNIDKLSSDSILFKNAIASAPWTSPSIASIFTSQYPVVLGFNDQPVVIKDKFLTLAEIFQQNKYKTKGIISHVFISSVLKFNQGFQSYDDENAKGHGHISSPSLVEKAISFLKKSRKKNFFLFVHFFDPHFDYIIHEKYNYYPSYNGTLHSGQNIDRLRANASVLKKDDISFVEALYDSEISFTDEFIGKLIEKLKDFGLFDNTLIVLTSDHGEEFSERGDHWIGHTKKVYQEQIHVPLIVKQPGSCEEKIIEEYFDLIDLMPTIIESANLKIPNEHEYEGRAINLKEKDPLINNPIISETRRWANLRSVTWKDWKYIWNLEIKSKELYDLKNDPKESQNIASINKTIINELETILLEWENHIKSKKIVKKNRQPIFNKEQIEHLKSLGYIK